MDETRARVLLAEGRVSEAENVARVVVLALEKGGRLSLLAEALTTHGTSLARLDYCDQSCFTLQRAVELAHQSGALNVAGFVHILESSIPSPLPVWTPFAGADT